MKFLLTGLEQKGEREGGSVRDSPFLTSLPIA